ncbi:hypothetical protein E0Z10_g838 [Xylaria hypoxylon]|uniref:Uncharacterized protein n=1 Tax=Xylaria hypoxylon TaxID=37992 RepID=A0A4Z0ZGE0_9PEZI|nr:hypothetical protein E0Z10_g838 [Xylaria hypoxylon]
MLELGTTYKNISRQNHGARFILLTFTADSHSSLVVFSQEQRVEKDLRSDNTDSIHAFFADMEEDAGQGGGVEENGRHENVLEQRHIAIIRAFLRGGDIKEASLDVGTLLVAGVYVSNPADLDLRQNGGAVLEAYVNP